MRYIFYLIIILMFFTSSTALSDQWFGNGTFVYISIGVFLATLVFFRNIEVNYNPKLLLSIFAFVFFGIIASLINSDIALLLSALGYFVLFLSATIIIPSYFKSDSGKVMIWTILISQIPILLWPILTNGIDTYPYRGIFNNSNSLGGVAATVFVVLLAILLQRFESFIYSKNKQSKMILLFLFIASSLLFLLVIMTGSRTSFVACVFALSIGLLFFLAFTFKHRLLGNLFVKGLVILPLLGLIFWVTNKIIPITSYAEEIIFSKFTQKSSSTLDGRDWVWEMTIKESGLFGNGSNYFSVDVGLGAHNTFISILGQYGWLALIAVSVFLIIGLFHSFGYALSDNKYKYLPLLMLVTFLSLSMGEVMLYKLSMISSFILTGIVANNKKIVVK